MLDIKRNPAKVGAVGSTNRGWEEDLYTSTLAGLLCDHTAFTLGNPTQTPCFKSPKSRPTWNTEFYSHWDDFYRNVTCDPLGPEKTLYISGF